ncbi:uncharacterized protein LOC128861004 [Anastrepha ludens]|uniref:uncharacterized protein LOC128861004 n=1 Tax=Anastrepha ludens TaxID=28586 RepID=UPI0023AE9D03|nr:uncharacterized protein LOC128861004 [Anastrepha ludens]
MQATLSIGRTCPAGEGTPHDTNYLFTYPLSLWTQPVKYSMFPGARRRRPVLLLQQQQHMDEPMFIKNYGIVTPCQFVVASARASLRRAMNPIAVIVKLLPVHPG